MPPRPVPYDENGQRVAAGEGCDKSGLVDEPADVAMFTGKNPPSVGNVNIPVLLVDFQGQPGQTTPAQFTNILFTPSPGGNVSMHDYYQEVSRGLLNVGGQVYGWFTLPNAPGLYVGGQGGRGDSYPMNYQGLVRDAVNAADATVDFRQFDNDGPDGVPNSGDDDGFVDCLSIVFSGYGSESYWPPNPRNRLSSTMMWMDWGWRGPGPLTTADGTKIQLFVAQSELRNTSGSAIRDIGVYCHEFAHALGLPDMWQTILPNLTATFGTWNSVGEYSLMAMGAWGAGGTNPDQPTHLTGYEKGVLGWANPVHVTVDLLGCSIPDVETTGTIYCNFPFWPGFPPDLNLQQRFFAPSWLTFPPPVEGFIVENRQPIGFDSGLSGSGLLIYHFDGRIAYQDYFNGNPPFPNWFQNSVQWSENQPLLDVECADQTGLDHTFNADDLDAQNNFGNAGDYFQNSVTGFDAFTNPSSMSYNSTLTGFAVRNIGPSGATMTADIVVGSPSGPGHDIWVKDCPVDNGSTPSATVCDCWGYRMQFASPDLWIDNDQDGTVDQPVQGATNRLFIKVRNRGFQGIDYGSVEVYDHSQFLAPPASGPPVNPANPFEGLARVCSLTIQSLAAGDSMIFQVPWYVQSSPPPPNWNFPPSLGLLVQTATDTLNGTADISGDNNLAMATGRKMWIRGGQSAKRLSARDRKLALLKPGTDELPAEALGGEKEDPPPEPAYEVLPINNPFEEPRDIMIDVEADLPPGCTTELYLPEYFPGPVATPVMIPMDPLQVTPLEIIIVPGTFTQHGHTGFITVHEYLPETYPEEALGGMSVPIEVDVQRPLPVAAVNVELFERGGCVPYNYGAWLSFEPVEYDVGGWAEGSVWYGVIRDTIVVHDPVDPGFFTEIITTDSDGDTSWWEWANIDYPIGWPERPPHYQLVAVDAAGNVSDPTTPLYAPASADYGDHDYGSARLTVTDQGITGYMEVPGRGNGFQYPKGTSSILWTGGLWVGVSESQVDNRDYEREEVKDWEKSEAPNGAVQYDQYPAWLPQLTENEGVISTMYRDTGNPDPIELLVEQVSVDCADAPYDDFVIVCYRIENQSGEWLSDLYAGQFMDFDVGDPAGGAPWNNQGGTDAGRDLAYMWAEGESIHAGVCLLQPDAVANVAYINNPNYVYVHGHILDSDKYGFLSGSDPAHSVQTTTAADDYGVVVSAGPHSLPPGGTVTVCFAILGGDNLADIQANADAAHDKFNSLVAGVDGGVSPRLPDRLAVGPNFPNPFNPSTRIGYALPRTGRVEVAVFDLTGRRVATLVEGTQEAGHHTVSWNVEGQPSGVYLLRVQAGRELGVRKMMLLK